MGRTFFYLHPRERLLHPVVRLPRRRKNEKDLYGAHYAKEIGALAERDGKLNGGLPIENNAT